MSKEYDNTNTGAAFSKDGFEGFSGTLNVDGKEYWVSVYDNVTKDGKPWRKLKVKPKDAQAKPTVSQKAQAPLDFDDDLDAPF